MGIFDRKPATPASPPSVCDDVADALSDLEERRQQQRIRELTQAGASVSKLVRCYPEATLFLNGIGRAMTGWRWRFPGGRLEVRYESGFRESPSEWATPRHPGAVLATGDDPAI